MQSNQGNNQGNKGNHGNRSAKGSQCQLFQLHIDAFLDNELEDSRAAELKRHLQDCAGCRQELDYARRLHHAVVSLPILDCSDQALEPVDRLFNAGAGPVNFAEEPRGPEQSGGFAAAVDRLLGWIPIPVRVAVPVMAVLVLLLGPGRTLLNQPGAPEVALSPGIQSEAPRFTEAEIMQALQDLELALDYLGEISARTEVMIEDRFLLRQLRESMNASLSIDPLDRPVDDNGNGPI